jgi:hypothetical protein
VEWSDVCAQAKTLGTIVHHGRVHIIVNIKGSELAIDLQKIKARIVFGGNNVTTNVWQQLAEFQDLGSSPAAMSAYRLATALGHAPGKCIEQADAEAAYLQSILTGTPTYVTLPYELQTPAERLMKNPVRLLIKSLYGHPDSGTCWEKHLFKGLESVGFSAVEGWESVFVHKSLGLMLVVYVDDFLLVGEKKSVDIGWTKIRTVVKLGDTGPLGHFLGCTHDVSKSTNADGSVKTTVSFNMQGYLEQAIKDFRTAAEDNKPFHPVESPFLTEDRSQLVEDAKPGKLALGAQSSLPKLLYAARLARPDLVFAINLLSRNLTKWQTYHDRALRRLFAYVNTSLALRLTGSIGAGTLGIDMFCDADHAGDLDTAKSTSGMILYVTSSNGAFKFPLEWGSKRQTAVSHSTPEAELVSLARGFRTAALPLQHLCESILNHPIHITAHEDNEATIKILSKGKSPALRHLVKTHRISLAWVAAVCDDDGVTLKYCNTNDQLADGFTKALDRVKFQTAVKAIGMV